MKIKAEDNGSTNKVSRRDFISFIGLTGASLAAAQFAACSSLLKVQSLRSFPTLGPKLGDELLVAPGFSYKLLIAWNQVINTRGETFGYNNDFLSFIPLQKEKPGDGLLWVNHESVHPGFVSGDWDHERSLKHVQVEQKAVGASIIRVRKQMGEWTFVPNDAHNRRLDATTPIPIVSPRAIAGSTTAIGTLANCAGGQTPWGSFLSCEENYADFYGERKMGETLVSADPKAYNWQKHFSRPPEHYGWVVEVDPVSGSARKLSALGRFSHEGATVVQASDGRCVVYMGDDAQGHFIYKFIAENKNSLDRGKLYAADTRNGRWLSLDLEDSPLLKKIFRDQTEVQTYTHEAAKALGATPQDRPEDIKIHPLTGDVFVALTNNAKRGNFHGSLLKIKEDEKDPLALRFQASEFLAGGSLNGFSCPDNLLFDHKGNLWMTSDISGRNVGSPRYREFGNNGLFYIPLQGPHAGRAHLVASAPRDAEFTGPMLAPDRSSLFLCVQHPGELTTDPGKATSQWPYGPAQAPAPAVITLQGPQFDKLMS